jgi:Sulfatase
MRRPEHIALGRRALGLLTFLAVWAALDMTLNLRFPGGEDRFFYLLPSLDIVGVFALYAILGMLGRAVPGALHAVLVGVFVLVRLLRVADGMAQRFLSRTFSLAFDLPLVPELVRLLRSTLPAWQFVAVCAAVPMALVALGLLLHRCLRTAEQRLSEPPHRVTFAAVVGVLLLLSLRKAPADPDLYTGSFAASAAPRVAREVTTLLGVRSYRRAREEAMRRTQRTLAATPANLSKLHGADVLLFLIESYGATVLHRSDQKDRILPAYRAMEEDLERGGFVVASGLLGSPTYGGGSWLAQATLATGIRIDDQPSYGMALAAKPKTLARIFHDAGYRTVLAAPGTTRKWPQEGFYQFDQEYAAWDFDYRGPSFDWATMPDQYVLDVVRRKEEAVGPRPRLVEYALVSSHAPWSRQPRLVDDWSSLGDGTIYRDLEPVRHPVTWSNLADGSTAYVDSVLYDLEVLKRYIGQFVRDDTLVIILGDHQPPAEVTLRSPDRSVPIHVLSRDKTFVDAFLARGYTPGMEPVRTAPPPGMETFLVSFLRDFSTDYPEANR